MTTIWQTYSPVPVPLVSSEPVRVSPPAALPLSLAELRAQCRLTDDDGTDEDALLMAYLRAAVEYTEQYTGLALITQTWQQTFSAFPSQLYHPKYLTLTRRPVRSVESVVYRDTAGVEQTLDSSIYNLRGIGREYTVSTLELALSQSWPATAVDPEAVTVTYVAGFGDDHNAVPEMIRHALMLLTAYWFNQRESALIDPQIVEVPFGTTALLDPWRPFAVA